VDTVKQVASGNAGNAVIVDARPTRRYRSGHISGAAPIFWEKNLVDPEALTQVLKSPEQLRKMYVAAGVTPGKKVISYCEVGWQATYAYFIARYLGYDAAMYDGSWDDWSKQKQPVVRGDSAR
jgi:thiosulfate/3-mercaptopyruvate sulfurtransferase